MPAFRLKYYAELRSKYKGVFWRVEVAERGYAGSVEQMTFDGSDPLKITWEKRGDEFYAPVKASEATINILCHENFHYINLFTSDPCKFRVSIYRNTVLYCRGFVTADHDTMTLIVSAMSRMENGVPVVIKDVEQGWRLSQQQKT